MEDSGSGQEEKMQHMYRGLRMNQMGIRTELLLSFVEKKTWEHALLHCSQEHTTLTSLVSETEDLQALRKIQHDDITERVWIGLRFLGDRWLWVDGDPLVYENWAEGGEEDYQCPRMKRCGALTKGGQWENWDCEDSLHFICY
ncbi:secretory phospholipase A2 receptor-like [Morone saxatilis]|uniref:secretory phospholipase A2 receptor-like n=1 Tax=Morone saxatilis TaxID=34816 RepID=UPI0015E254B4|nr:secretory phospholipase A2 receptor-like [Morone saxatilis]